MLVIYDDAGKIYLAGTGFPEPVGQINHVVIDVPEGYGFKGMDVSKTPHKPIFEEYPKSEIQILQEKVAILEEQNKALIEGANSMR